MKAAVSFAIFVALLAVSAYAEEKYTTKFDNINVHEILHNDRLLNRYVDCLLEKGRCPAEGIELKKVLPDALETGCAKCSEKQRKFAEEAMKYLSENKKEQWDKLLAHYDPEGKYRSKFMEEAKAANIKI